MSEQHPELKSPVDRAGPALDWQAIFARLKAKMLEPYKPPTKEEIEHREAMAHLNRGLYLSWADIQQLPAGAAYYPSAGIVTKEGTKDEPTSLS